MSAPRSVEPLAPAPAAEPLLRQLVGEVLRAERNRQGRTLREVASGAGVSMAYLSEIERGRKEPSSEVLAAVCRALGIRTIDLVARAYHLLVPWVDRTLVSLAPHAGPERRQGSRGLALTG